MQASTFFLHINSLGAACCACSKKSTMPVYCYEGLYRVADARMEEGIHGKQVCKYDLRSLRSALDVAVSVPSQDACAVL